MKTMIPLGAIGAMLFAFAACSEDEGTPRPSGNAGTGTSNAGTMSSMAGNNNSGGTGGMGNTGGPTAGPALEIDGLAISDEDGTSGIDGGVFFARSPEGNDTVTLESTPDGLCASGTVEVVGTDANGGADYGNYWGVEIDFNPLLVPREGDNGGGGPPADAGTGDGAGDPDAGAVADAGGGDPPVDLGDLEAAPWDYGAAGVVGFSYVMTDMTDDGTGMPGALRFKAQPTGSDSANDVFCYPRSLISGQADEVLFTQITRDCWTAGGQSIVAYGEANAATDGDKLDAIGWQVPASEQVPYTFNFCVSDIRPLMAD